MNLQQNLRILSYGVKSRVPVHEVGASSQPQRVIIDYSSPNIAKPFHFGHLKSTILGNFLANLHKHFGNEVIRINYIGDWGTQYGLLSLGLDESSNKGSIASLLKRNENGDHSDQYNGARSLEQLLNIYIEANKRASNDDTFYEQAKKKFKALESGRDAEQLERWRLIRDISLDELKNSYSHLGIEFDVYEHESDYSTMSLAILDRMKSLNLLKARPDGILVTEVIKNNRVIEVPLKKSDGSTLYITRDIAAAFNRKQTYKFDKMLYIVGADQEKHFDSLCKIIKKFDGCHWADDLMHVKTGKVVGMSSRFGQAVLLSKIIEEATKNYIESTKNIPTSKIDSSSNEELEEVGKHLALSALYVFDMRNKRTRNYEFSWSQVMHSNERSGIHLQTSHARLCSLLDKALMKRDLKPFESVEEINYDSICCVEGVQLINAINEIEDKLIESYQSLDPSPLVNHAIALCKATNRARQSDWLHVINEMNDDKARSRLTLFESARRQLEFIIKMIGLKPLTKV